MTVFGTRPDTIKMAPVVHALAARAGHRDDRRASPRSIAKCSTICSALFDRARLRSRRHDAKIRSLTEITTRVLTGMEPVLAEAQPDVVLVHGDTTTSTAAALAAFYAAHCGRARRGGAAHRTIAWMPFPEEMNRRLTGTIASYHFAPTPLAREHLLREHVAAADIVVTGNTVIDAFLRNVAPAGFAAAAALERARPDAADRGRHRAPPRKSRAHARDVRWRLREIAAAAGAADLLAGPPVAARRPGRARGARRDSRRRAGRPDRLRRRWSPRCAAASFVLTDSGGLQEEAPCLGKAGPGDARGDRTPGGARRPGRWSWSATTEPRSSQPP